MHPIVLLLQQYSACGSYTSVGIHYEALLQVGQLQHKWVTQQFAQLFKSMLLLWSPHPYVLGQHDMHQRCSNVRKVTYALSIVICKSHQLLQFLHIGRFRPSAHS